MKYQISYEGLVTSSVLVDGYIYNENGKVKELDLVLAKCKLLNSLKNLTEQNCTDIFFIDFITHGRPI